MLFLGETEKDQCYGDLLGWGKSEWYKETGDMGRGRIMESPVGSGI